MDKYRGRGADGVLQGTRSPGVGWTATRTTTEPEAPAMAPAMTLADSPVSMIWSRRCRPANGVGGVTEGGRRVTEESFARWTFYLTGSDEDFAC